MQFMSWRRPLLLFLLHTCISQECQRVTTTVREVSTTAEPATYNDIEPNEDGCMIQGMFLRCGLGEGVLSDGDIGPTHSVDLNDREQVQKFFIWHRDDGLVSLQLEVGPSVVFNVSYVDIYTLGVPEEKIGSPVTTSFTFVVGEEDINISPESCSLSSSDNTLSRNIYILSETIDLLIITFTFNESIDWLFISEIKLCSGDPPSPNMCDTLTPTTTPSPTPSTDPPPPPPTPPPIILSYPPLTGITVTPDLNNPESVNLTCSVTSPPTNDYQYQWQWLKNGILLTTHTQSTNTQSTTLLISDLQYSDAGDYTCTVEYIMCSDRIDCSETTPVTGTITLNLPVVVKAVSSESVVEGSVVVLSCEVYGYPRNSSSPVWTSSHDLQSGRFSVSSNSDLLTGDSVALSDRVISQLTIVNVTMEDAGEYTCSVQGNSTTITLVVIDGSFPSSSNSGMIVGIVIAVLVFIIALIATVSIILYMVWRYRKDGKLDSCSCSALSCGACSCLALCVALKNVKMPIKRHHNSNRNGVLTERQHTANDIEVQVYSTVHKTPKKAESPPPLPPLTLTETELSELMCSEEAEMSPTNQMRSRRNTTLSTYSQSGSCPKLAKLSKLKHFKMKENPIYQSADELELDDKDVVYALPSKGNSRRNSGSMTDETTSDPIYSEAIDPSMFTKRASTIVTDDDLHPYGPIYAKPIKQKSRQPLNVNEDNICEVKRIGVGQFGAVLLAKMSGLSATDIKTLPKDAIGADGVALVAVKRLKPDVSDEIRQSFDKEIKFMSQLQHENIVQLLAVCTRRDNPFIVMEYMENGDLNQFLQKYQMVSDDEAVYSNQIPPSALLYMAVQIASGMCYLSSLNYVHRDLATRNCLVGSNFRIKISDFGMSRNLYERVYYRVRGRAMLPIRWMATESFYGRFSEKSDVWAYGVVVWEIFTLGKKQPYEKLDDQEMIQDAIRGTGRRIMNKPDGCPQAVYEVMLSCWEYSAADRATFKDIHQSLFFIQQST